MKKIILGILCLNLFQSQAQSWTEVVKALDANNETGDQFGYSVAISDKYAVIGAPSEKHDATNANALPNAGSVFIFERANSGGWDFKQKITASDRAQDDNFGQSVAISGGKIIVGAPFEDEDATGGTTVANAGSCYIFELDVNQVWAQTQKIVASDRESGDNFGTAVSISNNYLIVTAPYEDHNATGTGTQNNAGSAYIFEKNGSSWTQVQKIVASDRISSDRFGISVSMSGGRTIIGARFDGKDAAGANPVSFAGSAYIFERDMSGSWLQHQKIVASDREATSWFGGSVSIYNDYVLVGAFGEDKNATGADALADAGAAYFFERNGTGTWSQIQKVVASDRKENNQFGYSVSLGNDFALIGARLSEATIGANTYTETGTAYFFKFDGTNSWSESQKVNASDANNSKRFSSAVAVYGNYANIGDFTEGAYIYEFICQNQSSVDTRVSCDPIIWIDGNTYSSDNNTATHTYVGGAANGCDSTVTLNLTIISSVVNTVTVHIGTYTADQTGATYQWLDCNNGNAPISGETNQSFTPTTNGDYAVVISAGGCSDTSACIAINNVGVETVDLSEFTSIYPNPSGGQFTVDVPENAQLIITDLSGRMIQSVQLEKGQTVLNMNENSGVYLLNFTTEKGQFTQRLTIH